MRKALLAFSLWLVATAAGIAGDPTGKAVGVDPTAEADLGSVTRTLVVGSDVAVGETVVTGSAGLVQLLFSDQTKLLVGPKSSLKIEAYLLRSDNKASQFAVNALSGTFRFITGKSAKPAYRIDTPNGSIGVRGTAFDFNVDDLGTTLVLFHGSVRMCASAGSCVNMVQACGVGNLSGSNATALTQAQQRARNLRARFRYVRSDSSLLSPFRVSGASRCLQPPSTTPRSNTRTVPPRGPTHITPPSPPPRLHRPPVVVQNPCFNYRYLSPAEKEALRRNHIYCAGGRPPPPNLEPEPGGLIHINPFPPHRPPRGTGGTYGGSDGGTSTDGGSSTDGSSSTDGGPILY